MVPRWLPNALSILRIALVPVWLCLAWLARTDVAADPAAWRPLLLGVFVALGATDIVDGFLARRFQLATNLGATLDAVADKLAQVATVTWLTFVPTPGCTPLPLWLFWALAARDGLMGAGFLAVWWRHRHVEVRHRWHGKLSSLVLFALVVAAIAGAPQWSLRVAAAASLLLVVPGTLVYLREGWNQLTRPAAA